MTASAATRISSTLEVDQDFHRTYTSVYEVQTTTTSDGPKTAINATDIPAYGSSYSWLNDTDSWAFCTQASAAPKDITATGKLWRVTVIHTTRPMMRERNTPPDNPLNEPPLIYGSFVGRSIIVEFDKDNTPITNSAGDPVVPAVEDDDNLDTLFIEVNTDSIDLSQRSEYRRAVNSQTIWGLPARTVRLRKWGWTVQYHGINTSYIRHTYEFLINTEENVNGDAGHVTTLLDQGYRELVDANAANKSDRYREIFEANGVPKSTPTMLDGAGLVIDIKNGSPPDDPVFHTWKTIPEQPFQSLPGVPDPLPGPF